jgi:hypothetical protein
MIMEKKKFIIPDGLMQYHTLISAISISFKLIETLDGRSTYHSSNCILFCQTIKCCSINKEIVSEFFIGASVRR